MGDGADMDDLCRRNAGDATHAAYLAAHITHGARLPGHCAVMLGRVVPGTRAPASGAPPVSARVEVALAEGSWPELRAKGRLFVARGLFGAISKTKDPVPSEVIAEYLPRALAPAVERALELRENHEAALRGGELPADPARLAEWFVGALPSFDEIHLFFSPECERDSFVGALVWRRGERGVFQAVDPRKSCFYHGRLKSPAQKCAEAAAEQQAARASF